MADRVVPGPVDSSASIHEAVCIHTSKIFDSCRDKDCIEDLRVFPTVSSQAYIDNAFSIRPRCAELLKVSVRVNEVTFNRGYYTVDVTYFYKVKGEVFPGNAEVTGLAIFDKRVLLFGSEGNVKIFTSCSDGRHGEHGCEPKAVVEAVNPIALNMKLADKNCCSCVETAAPEIPGEIIDALGEDVVLGIPCRIWYATLGQFSIIRLERDSQLVVPVYDYCFPDKECVGSTDDDPCTLFGKIRFPIEEFFPPDSLDSETEYKNFT